MGRRRGTSAFPVARIKKMMQSDDDVGKIATVTPLLVAKALELMMEYVLKEAAQVAQERHTKTVTPQHLKACVMNNESFDFLRDVLKSVQSVDVDKPRRRRSKRPRSPVVEGRRVRRGRSDDAGVKTDQQEVIAKEEKREDEVVEHDIPVPSHVAAAVEKHAEDDDDDYDEDDEHATDTQKASNDDTAAIPIESDSQNAPGRMSVSALLS